MSINRTAKGIVLVPSLLLGGAFLAAGTWMEGAAAANRPLAFTLGGVLVAAGLFTQLLPESQEEGATLDEPEETTPPARPGRSMGKVLGNPGKIGGTPGSVGGSTGRKESSAGRKGGSTGNPGGPATNDGGGAQPS
jgi:hypothetical protein